jgi:crossover junction endodeoxyribonuclease RuvC
LKDFDKIILGIDPGTNIMGYGLVGITKSNPIIIQYGVIKLDKFKSQQIKLKKIFERVNSLIEDYLPDEMAIEAPFFGKNVQSMLKLGRAQGVAMAAGLVKDIPITEYSPKSIKQSVTGNGNASKEQVAKLIVQIFKLKEVPELLDATDALGVALCHFYSTKNGLKEKAGKKDWSSFIKENPKRLKS